MKRADHTGTNSSSGKCPLARLYHETCAEFLFGRGFLLSEHFKAMPHIEVWIDLANKTSKETIKSV